MLGEREQAPTHVSDLTEMRARAFTLLDIAYDQLRRAISFLRWDEGDVDAMAAKMSELAAQPALAEALGRAARRRVEARFGIDAAIDRLWRILEHAARGEAAPC